ncbi:MAG TPA: type II toxin-antitoxin system VapB family antitoxin [Thermoanaerobaculia bacterium]
MALSIKSPEVEKLVEALAAMTGESKTETVRRALEERRERLRLQQAHRERGSDSFAISKRRSGRKLRPGNSAAVSAAKMAMPRPAALIRIQ